MELLKPLNRSLPLQIYRLVLKSIIRSENVLIKDEDFQCFGKCFIERSGFVNGNGINVQRLVEVSILLGKDEQKTRLNLEKCTRLYKRNRDCATSWDLYVCLHKIYQS